MFIRNRSNLDENKRLLLMQQECNRYGRDPTQKRSMIDESKPELRSADLDAAIRPPKNYLAGG